MSNVARLALAGLVIQWPIINLLWPEGREYLDYLYHMGTWQFQGSDYNIVFPFTFSAALALFLLAFYTFRFGFKLDWARTHLFSISLPFASTSLFEEIYQDIGSVLHVAYINPPVEAHLINMSSILFGLTTITFWKASRIFYAALTAYVLLWGLWVLGGFPQIYEAGDPAFAITVNTTLKILSYFLLGALLVGGAVVSASKKEGKSKPNRCLAQIVPGLGKFLGSISDLKVEERVRGVGFEPTNP